MRCPKCGTLDDKVIDSRLSKDGATIRRRRECLDCQSRFTTYEVLERNELRVIKRDGRLELFERGKLLGSIAKACEKRSVNMESIEHVVEDILQEIENSQDREISSKHLGALVMARLHALDPVAYVRYASVYRQFQEVGDFIEEIESLGRRVATTPDQAELFKKVIALRDNYPLVRFQDGSVMNYDRAWLASAVVRAAEVAGYKKWWLTTHVTESISSYLQQEFDENIVTISRLEKAVQSVLQVIGYSDVARCFETLPPPVTLSLPDLARRAATGYELVFFSLLHDRLGEILASPARQVEIHGLHDCVKLLRCAKHWSNDCASLMSEIVSFIRTEAASSHRAHELNLQLA